MKVDKTQNYILVNVIIYFNCIIANTSIAMVYYNYQVSHPHSSSSTTTYYYYYQYCYILLSSKLATLLFITHDLYSSSITIQELSITDQM